MPLVEQASWRAGRSEMHRQPDSLFGRISPGHPVTATGRDQCIIADAQLKRLRSVIKLQPRTACQDQYPLVVLLIVPFALRGGLTVGNDALDAHSVRCDDGIKNL